MAQLRDEQEQRQYYGEAGFGNPCDQDEPSDEEECGDTDEHIIHSAATFNPSGMISSAASDSAPPSQPSSATQSQRQSKILPP